MILIGSEAARRTGCLPDWREGREPADIDLVGTREAFWELSAYLTGTYPLAISHDRGNNRMAIRAPLPDGGRILIDFVTMDLLSSQLLADLPDHTDDVLLGQPVKVVSCLTQLVTKMAHQPFPVYREKTDADVAFWEARVGDEEWSPEHQAFHDQLRAEYALWEPAQP